MRYDQEAYFQKYGSNVLWSYAPKSDTILVVIFVLLCINGFGYLAQYQRWQNVADRLVKAAVEDWSPAQGGTNESKDLRDHAIEVLEERQKSTKGDDDGAAATSIAKSPSSSQW